MFCLACLLCARHFCAGLAAVSLANGETRLGKQAAVGTGHRLACGWRVQVGGEGGDVQCVTVLLPKPDDELERAPLNIGIGVAA